MIVNIYKQSVGRKFAVRSSVIKKIVGYILEKYLPSYLPGKKYQVAIYLVSTAEMIRLNKRFFKRDYATDVISCPLELDSNLPRVLLGEIFVCVETAARQAAQYGHTYLEEMKLLIVHGLLHLLGYDDVGRKNKKIMRREEEKLLKAIREF